MKILMICGEDILNPIGGRGVYLKHVCEEMCSSTDIVVLTPTASGTNPGFFLCGKDSTEMVTREKWNPSRKKYRIFKAFFYNDYPVLDDKNIIVVDGKKVIVEGHGQFMFEEFKSYYNFVLNLSSHMKDMNFDIVHVHDSDLWFLAQTCGQFFKSPIVFSSHLSENLGPTKLYTNPHWRLSTTREAFALKDSARIHTLSTYYAKELVDFLPSISEKITVIPNAVNSDYLKTVEYDKNLRVERLGKFKKIITLVGRFVPQKGIDFFLEAVKNFPEYKFILISVYSFTQDKGCEDFERKANEILKTCDNFDWESGYDQDLKWKLMKISDVGLVPSRYGSYEIVVAEWMALSVPVIISDKCPIIEYLPAECCDIIEPSAENVIESISKFKRDEDKIKRAFDFAVSATWKKTAEDHIKMYEDVLKNWDGDLNERIFYSTDNPCDISI